MKRLIVLVLVLVLGLSTKAAWSGLFESGSVPPHGDQALVEAALEGNFRQVEKLLDEGADPNSYNKKRESVLYYLACWGNLDLVQKMLDKGAEPDIADYWSGRTPIMEAARAGKLKMCLLLISHGANFYAPDRSGESALTYLSKSHGTDAMGGNELVKAASLGNLPLITRILDSGVDPNQSNQEGFTPLCQAVGRGHLEAVKMLVFKGARLDTKCLTRRQAYDLPEDSYRATALDWAKADPTRKEIAAFFREWRAF